MARYTSKTDINNMSNGEFKAVIIRIFTGLERVENITDHLHRDKE